MTTIELGFVCDMEYIRMKMTPLSRMTETLEYFLLRFFEFITKRPIEHKLMESFVSVFSFNDDSSHSLLHNIYLYSLISSATNIC